MKPKTYSVELTEMDISLVLEALGYLESKRGSGRGAVPVQMIVRKLYKAMGINIWK